MPAFVSAVTPGRLWGRAEWIGAAAAGTLLLLWGAILNGFPLVHPDSATYLTIVDGRNYAVDRSSFYGLLLKPFAAFVPGTWGLWIGLAVQATAVTIVLLLAARTAVPHAGPHLTLAVFAALCFLSALPWHAGQIMPDAFAGPVVLLAWLAASREPGAPGTASLWLATALLALTHYTHLALLGATVAATLAIQAMLGRPQRSVARAVLLAATTLAISCAALVGANALFLGRAAVSPAGNVFLFARLHEDGLSSAWLDQTCGRGAPEPLCEVRASLPRDSQTLLWGRDSPLDRLIWDAPDAVRWGWIDQMATANRGAIAAQPEQFLRASARGTAAQLSTFAALDDECPEVCALAGASMMSTLRVYRPDAVGAFARSRQARGSLPNTWIRAATTPFTALALLLLPVALAWACWRRDMFAASLLGAVGTTLIVNAALAGALSDVHARYQSRVAWLAPLALLLIWLDWRARRRDTPAGAV